jgi:hypothetical protein
MSKDRRQNHEARKKRGPEAFKKKAERRHIDSHNRPCPWWITFSCDKREYINHASGLEIDELAIKEHRKSNPGRYHQACIVTKHEPQR